MESTIGLYETELIKPRGPWWSLAEVELATAEYVDWYNNRRLHLAIGGITPTEHETAYSQNQPQPVAAGPKPEPPRNPGRFKMSRMTQLLPGMRGSQLHDALLRLHSSSKMTCGIEVFVISVRARCRVARSRAASGVLDLGTPLVVELGLVNPRQVITEQVEPSVWLGQAPLQGCIGHLLD